MVPGTSGTVRDRLRGGLREAMKARDPVAVAALRSALAAIDNAEAVDGAQAPPPAVGHPYLAGTVAGLRGAEVERRSLAEAQVEGIVRAEVTARQAAARDYEDAGRHERAERLRGEAGVLLAYLGAAEPPAG